MLLVASFLHDDPLVLHLVGLGTVSSVPLAKRVGDGDRLLIVLTMIKWRLKHVVWDTLSVFCPIL